MNSYPSPIHNTISPIHNTISSYQIPSSSLYNSFFDNTNTNNNPFSFNTNYTTQTKYKSASQMRNEVIDETMSKIYEIIEKNKHNLKCKFNINDSYDITNGIKDKLKQRGYLVKIIPLEKDKLQLTIDWSGKKYDKNDILKLACQLMEDNKDDQDNQDDQDDQDDKDDKNKEIYYLLDAAYQDGIKDIYSELAIILKDNGFLEKSIKYFKEHLKINRDDDKIIYELANIYMVLGNLEHALELLFQIKDEKIAGITNKLFWEYLGKKHDDKPIIKMDFDTLIMLCQNFTIK